MNIGEDTDAAFLAKHLGTPGLALAPADVDALLGVVDRVEVTSGGLIFSQHDLSEDVFIVRSGCISLSRYNSCLLYTSPSPRDRQKSRMPSSA